jgi:hypothetical protein
MADELVSVINIAREFGTRRQTVFKVLRRLGIRPIKQRSASHGNQFISYITQEELTRVTAELALIFDADRSAPTGNGSASEIFSAETGVFYLVQLDANHDPGRFKVGFAANLGDRLRALRCSAPFATVVKSWNCRRLWERTIDCVTAGCERLHAEVFRAESLQSVAEKCDKFFSTMPPI